MANIMIVDDAAFMRNMLKDILMEGGHNVVGEAANGIEAIKNIKKCNPDIVTLDITMPEMDGLTCLSTLKELCPDVKIIMISALGQQKVVVDSIQSGAVDFIIKPFQKDRILEIINNHI